MLFCSVFMSSTHFNYAGSWLDYAKSQWNQNGSSILDNLKKGDLSDAAKSTQTLGQNLANFGSQGTGPNAQNNMAPNGQTNQQVRVCQCCGNPINAQGSFNGPNNSFTNRQGNMPQQQGGGFVPQNGFAQGGFSPNSSFGGMSSNNSFGSNTSGSFTPNGSFNQGGFNPQGGFNQGGMNQNNNFVPNSAGSFAQNTSQQQQNMPQQQQQNGQISPMSQPSTQQASATTVNSQTR